jgi:chemotaxis signal transduction protein
LETKKRGVLVTVVNLSAFLGLQAIKERRMQLSYAGPDLV